MGNSVAEGSKKESKRMHRATLCYSRIIGVVRAYWDAILAASCLLFFIALIFAGKIPTKQEFGQLALILAPILAWLGLAGMAIIAALAVPSILAPFGISIEGKEIEWVIWVLILTLLASFVYSLLFPNFLVAVALSIWYITAFFFFNEEAAVGIMARLFW